MSENEIVHKRSPLNPSLPPPLLSSIELGWKGLVVERYSVPPCELPDVPIVDHIVELVSQEHVSVGERPDWRGHLRPYSKYPGTSNFFPDGIRPKIRSFTQTDYRLIAQGISSSKDPAILAFRIRQARAMHRGYELSPFPLTTNPTHITELEPITARREGARSNPLEGDLFDAGFDSLWEINFFSAHRNSTQVADAVYGTSAFDLQAIQVSVEGEIARNYFELQASLGRWSVAETHAQTLARILKIAEGHLPAGKGTVFETERARVLLAYTRTASLRMKAERAVALDCLAVLLGRSPNALAEELSHSVQLSHLGGSFGFHGTVRAFAGFREEEPKPRG
jgi:hypothetical protein